MNVCERVDGSSLDTAISMIPRGMIWRAETYGKGQFLCLIGWPTAKGNFSSQLGKYVGIGELPSLAVNEAVAKFMAVSEAE